MRGCVETHENVGGRSQDVCVGAGDEAGDEAGAGGEAGDEGGAGDDAAGDTGADVGAEAAPGLEAGADASGAGADAAAEGSAAPPLPPQAASSKGNSAQVVRTADRNRKVIGKPASRARWFMSAGVSWICRRRSSGRTQLAR
jgi:hypothetical protein